LRTICVQSVIPHVLLALALTKINAHRVLTENISKFKTGASCVAHIPLTESRAIPAAIQVVILV